MPELPEVETVARTLRPHVVNCRITAVHLLRPGSLHALSLPPQSLVGLRVSAVRRRGKLLLFDLVPPDSLHVPNAQALAHVSVESSQPDLLAVHLRMTGRLMTWPESTLPGPHTRCIIDLVDADGCVKRLFFDDVRAFGLLLAATPSILAQWDFWRFLGPEPLEIDAAAFAARLQGQSGQKNSAGPALKAALLDQKIIAGVGNIYADEALFDAGLDPRVKSACLDQARCARLLTSLQKVLRLSIEQCGSSIRDYRDADGNVGAFQNSFAVYGRGGKPCVRCARPLQKARVAGRATVYCSHCQS